MLLDYIFRSNLPASSAVALDSSRGIFKLNYQVRREKGGNGKGGKKVNGLPSHLSLRTLKKLAHEAV